MARTEGIGEVVTIPGLDLAEAVLALHEPEFYELGKGGKVRRCSYCASLCHSREGLSCDDPTDAVYPCDTAKLVLERFPILAMSPVQMPGPIDPNDFREEHHHC